MIPLSMLVTNYIHNFFPSINQDLSSENERKIKLLKLLEWKKKLLNFISEIYLITMEDSSKFDFACLKVILDFEQKNIIEQAPTLDDEKYVDFFMNNFLPFCNKIIDILNLQGEEIFLDNKSAKKIDLNNFQFFFEFFVHKLFKSFEKKANKFQINEIKKFLNNFCEVDYIDHLCKDLVCEEKQMSENSKINESENTKKERWETFKNLVYESDIIKNVSINKK